MTAWRNRLTALITLGAMAAGTVLCLLSGRTLAHVLSIWLCVAFVMGTVWLCDRYARFRQSRRVKWWTIGVSAAGFAWIVGFHLWSYASARYVFIFDYALYYYQQLELANHMNLGLSDTLPFVWRSVGTDYTYFANLLLAPLFSLTDRSIQAHGLCGVVMTWSLLLYQLRHVTAWCAKAMKLTENQHIALHGGVTLICCALPVLHRATSWCQVNLLGLPLLLTILILLWRCNFARPDSIRLTALLVNVMALVLMRRWFIFILAGVLIVWVILTVIDQLKRRDLEAFTNLIGYGFICICIGLTALWPLFEHAISGNYVTAYNWWKGGGLDFEVRNLTWLCGSGTLMLMAAGYVWGVLQRRSRAIRFGSGLMGASGVIALVLFNRIQSMNSHQVTILMPMIVTGLALLFTGLIRIPRQGWRVAGCAAMAALLLAQYGVSLAHEQPNQVSSLLPSESLKPPVRDDLEQLNAVADFIDEHCDGENQALFLCNSNEFDRLTFVSLRYPDLSMRQKVALQQISLPQHGFPAAWFSARYYVVPSIPVTNIPGGTAEKLTHLVHGELADQFRLVTQFDFGDFTLDVFERVGKAQWPEVETLLSAFAQESEQYPTLFRDRIGWYYQQQ